MRTYKSIADEFLRKKAREDAQALKVAEAELKAEKEAELKAEKEAELKAEKEAERAEVRAKVEAERAEVRAKVEAEKSAESGLEVHEVEPVFQATESAEKPAKKPAKKPPEKITKEVVDELVEEGAGNPLALLFLIVPIAVLVLSRTEWGKEVAGKLEALMKNLVSAKSSDSGGVDVAQIFKDRERKSYGQDVAEKYRKGEIK